MWLVTYNSSSTDLEAVDSSVIVLHTSVVPYYEFLGAALDSYRVVAAYFPPVFDSIGYIPTYHTSSLFWDSANVFYHTTAVASDYKHINMRFGVATAGPGFVGGVITSGGGKGTSSGVPVQGMLVFLIDAGSGVVVQHTYTDGAGHYHFSQLPISHTYSVFPEAINYTTTPYSGIYLSSSMTSVTAANFIQHTGSKTITPVYTQVTNAVNISPDIVVFPNPSSGELNIQYSSTCRCIGLLTITDVNGGEVFKSDIIVKGGNGRKSFDISTLANGFYLISVKIGDQSYSGKLQLRR